MRILLVYTNTNRTLSPPPVGLAYLMPPLVRAGHEVKVVDMMFAKDPVRELDRAIHEFRPDAAGFSVRNLDNHDMINPDNPLPAIKQCIGAAKSNGIPTILGGTAFSTTPKAMLKFMDADYGIAGQGEDSLPSLLQCIAQHRLDPSIPGLVWQKNGQVFANAPTCSGFESKQPDWSRINLRKYSNALFPAPVMAKTGCRFNCLYCDTPVSCGGKVIPRDIDAILSDMTDAVARFGTNRVYLIDPCLSHPIDFAKELFRAVIREGLKIRMGCNLEPARGCYDEELFDLYARAGGGFAILGCESLSDTMLQHYRKPFSVEDVRQWSAMAGKAGLLFGLQLLFGGPGECETTVNETLAMLPEIDFSLFMHGIGIRIYPGTAIQEIAIKEGILQKDDDLLFPRFYVSKQLDLKWAEARIRKATRRYAWRTLRLLPMVSSLVLGRFIKKTPGGHAGNPERL